MGTMLTADKTPAKSLVVGLWLAQVILALAFGMAGAMKTSMPVEELAGNLPWVRDLPNLVRFIGISELLGACGLILPAITRIYPILTPLAALGLLIVMILATGFHVMRGELQALPVNVVLGGICGFIAWGRAFKAPIKTRK
ncbi:MAG: DoxX family protein [Bacteriovoracia bacterium]